jgi:hypothetical protein
MRRMKALLVGAWVCLAAIPLACGDSDKDPDVGNAGKGGAGATGGTGGKATGGSAGEATGGSGGKATAGSAGEAGGSGAGGESGGEAGGAGGEAGLSDAARNELCETICDTTEQLSCEQERSECVAGWCLTHPLFTGPCKDRYDAVLACMAGEPVDGFRCVETGPEGVEMPEPKPTTCEAEVAAMDECLLANL